MCHCEGGARLACRQPLAKTTHDTAHALAAECKNGNTNVSKSIKATSAESKTNHLSVKQRSFLRKPRNRMRISNVKKAQKNTSKKAKATGPWKGRRGRLFRERSKHHHHHHDLRPCLTSDWRGRLKFGHLWPQLHRYRTLRNA